MFGCLKENIYFDQNESSTLSGNDSKPRIVPITLATAILKSNQGSAQRG
jgi:negative regulator of replication initiation